MTCAKCGKNRELCESLRINNIKQPRICKQCLILKMETGDESIGELFWIRQLIEAGDDESMIALGLWSKK